MSKPEKKFKCGPVSASIWAESKTVNGEMVKFYSISITKAYKDGDSWKNTTNFSAEDLSKVALVANEAYKYIRLYSPESQADSNQ